MLFCLEKDRFDPGCLGAVIFLWSARNQFQSIKSVFLNELPVRFMMALHVRRCPFFAVREYFLFLTGNVTRYCLFEL